MGAMLVITHNWILLAKLYRKYKVQAITRTDWVWLKPLVNPKASETIKSFTFCITDSTRVFCIALCTVNNFVLTTALTEVSSFVSNDFKPNYKPFFS